jgi:hypothetical protein
MEVGGLAPLNLIQSTIFFEMPVPSQGHCVFPLFRLLTDFVCLFIYEFLPLHLEDCSMFGNFVITLIYDTLIQDSLEH